MATIKKINPAWFVLLLSIIVYAVSFASYLPREYVNYRSLGQVIDEMRSERQSTRDSIKSVDAKLDIIINKHVKGE